VNQSCRSGFAALCGLVLVACSPGASAPDARVETDVADGDIRPFMGSWQTVGSIVAPWFVGAERSPEPDPEFLASTLVLAPASSTGPAALACPSPDRSVTTLPREALFEGAFTDVDGEGPALGVTRKNVPTLVEDCASANGDRSLSYHLLDDDTLLLALNDTVYQFDRVKDR